MAYDSKDDTLEHIEQVRSNLSQIVFDLVKRAEHHDRSKLGEIEKPILDEFTPKLKDSTYGSEEYNGFLKEMGEALEHHYAVNDHHPEHFEKGIKDMNLMQIIEMLADWYAATMRHTDGNMYESIRINAKRFDFGEELELIFLNTANDLGWIKDA